MMQPAVPASAAPELDARHAAIHAALDEGLARQRAFFATGATLDVAYRRRALERLLAALAEHEGRLLEALRQDLGKSPTEGYLSEVGMCREEVRHVLRHLRRWTRPRRVPTPLSLFAASSRVVPEPYGVALLLAPWNYPVQLSLEPLADAVAAGNCVVLKPSNQAPASAQALADLCAAVFDPGHVRVVLGDRASNAYLLEQRHDVILFTGSTEVGRHVMRAAARHLTPVVLELGGKSPVIVDGTAKVALAAKRIAFGKCMNAGQTCIAPDYVLVHESRKEELLAALAREFAAAYPQGLHDPALPRIVNEHHFDRLLCLLQGARVASGGEHERKSLRILPAVLDGVAGDHPSMAQEIFGPVLPVLAVRDLDEALRFVAARPKPLALFLFSEDRRVLRRVQRDVSFGGGTFNDTIVHIATPHMGFGGVGDSGMGAYHGKAGFDAFTHEKSIVDKKTWFDPFFRYLPYNRTKERLLRFFLG